MVESVAVVTGASSGIGRATALRLARDFSSVVLAARSGERLGEVAKQVAAVGAKPLAVPIDLSEPTAAEIVVRRTLQEFGRIDALLNIAGAVPGIDIFQMTDDQWRVGMELKFHAARRLTVRAWDTLRLSKGSVVFMSGNAAVMPKASTAAVGAINAAIEALAKAFSERGIIDGVQVNSVSPGAILTGRRLSMLKRSAEQKSISLEDAKEQFLRQAGICRFGSAEEIADLMAVAVSPSTRWLTGTVLRMDGGEAKSI